MPISPKIKSLAMEAGFDLVGITSPDPIPEAVESYQNWINNKYQGDMDYMGRNMEKRTHPKIVMPDVKSIICLGINYYNTNSPPPQSGKYGKVARYARGQDYHRVIEKKLKRLTQLIKFEVAQPDVELKYYVDYGPLLEKAYAEKAGLGFIGKNGNLISKEYGSFIFLAEVLTNLELEFDEPVKRACGECSRCIDNCPTKAIISPGVVDAKKCIAYHTIENKGEIPEDLKQKCGDRIFGCDVCQEVCPYNCRVKETRHEEFRGGREYIDVKKLCDIRSEEKFNEQFAGSPIKRPKLHGMRRNAEMVLKNAFFLHEKA